MKYFPYFYISDVFVNCTTLEVCECVDKHRLDDLLSLLQFVDAFRDFLGFPIVITSGYRDYAHNKRVGGVSTSQHMLGQALDFTCDGLEFDSFTALFREFVTKSALSRFLGQVIIYPDKKFIHIGLRTPSHKNLSIYEKRNN